DQSAWPQNEPVEFALLMQSFDAVENAGNHIVSTGSLSTGEYYSHVVWCVGTLFAGTPREGDNRHSKSVWEQFGNLLLVPYRLCCGSLLNFHVTLQSFGHLGLISGPRNL